MADHSNPNVIALKPPDAKDIKQRLLQSLPSTLHALLPNGVLRAGKFIVGDISGGKGESLDAMLERLQAASADHFETNPEEIRWGDAGFLADIARDLQHINDRVFKEGEYA